MYFIFARIISVFVYDFVFSYTYVLFIYSIVDAVVRDFAWHCVLRICSNCKCICLQLCIFIYVCSIYLLNFDAAVRDKMIECCLIV